MAEKEPSYDTSSSTRKRIRQTISVPFCWEERPGTPIKNWKPTLTPHTKPFSLPPVKLIASIPFLWEEKPGTPLPCFLEPLSSSILTLPAPHPNVFHVSSPMHTNVYDDDDDILSESESDDSFETADSLLGNGLISSVTLSNAVPFESMVENYQGISIGSPVSETGSEISSYNNGTTNVAGVSLLEWLFPLLTPRPETVVSNVEVMNQSKDLEHVKKGGVSTKKALTLGELIMMSRRQSYHRKAIRMQKQNLSKGGPNWRGFRCCIFRASKILHKIQMDWKRQLQIKLM